MIASVFFRRCGSYRMKVIVHIKQLSLCVSQSDFFIFQIFITCRHLCNLAMFFTHNMQYSLLVLIHVQVQCNLAITRFTYVNVCSLNCFDLFLKYKIGQTFLVCVFVLGSKCLTLFLLRDVFERLKCCLDPWLSFMFDCIYICVFPFLKNCF